MDMNRRHFFAAAGAVTTLGALGGTRAFAAGLATQWPIGMQLWTVGAEMEKDIPGTLKRVKDVGIQVVETAGLYGGTAAALKSQLAKAGLDCRSCHVSLGDMEKDIDKHIADAKTLGAKWLTASSPKPPKPVDPKKIWTVAMKEVMTEAAWKENAGIVAKVAPKIAAAGLSFAYHNHDMEFTAFNGRTGLNTLLAGSPLLRLELDLGWVAAAGHDPAATIKQYAGKVDLLHIKDMVKDVPEYRSVEVGKGIINWKPAFEAAKAAKVQNWFIEQEPPFKRPIFDSLAMSVPYLKAL